MNGRNRLLREWAGYVSDAAGKGALTGKPCAISSIECVAGPRAGALELLAGLESGRLLRAFSKNDAATLRQFVPWSFVGEPNCYMAGRYVRLEAGWPKSLAETMIRLSDLSPHPKSDGRWVTGKNETGRTVIAGLNDRTSHYLVSGQTGSGKSVTLRSAVLQLARDATNQIVLADGKFGESLHQVVHLRGVVGPVAVDGPTVRAALGWACYEMRQRYQAIQNGRQIDSLGRVIVVIDEFQEWAGDSVFVELVRKVANQGRAAGVHLLMSTQHPTVSAFGDPSVRRNLVGKLALRVDDADASRVAVGSNLPRADYLLGAGDAYAVAPGATHRIQGAYVDVRDFDQAGSGRWEFDTWPEYDAQEIGQDIPQSGRPKRALTAGEIGASLISAMEGEGRPALKNRLEAANLDRPGSDRARALLGLGRKVKSWLEDHNVGLVYLDDDGGEWEIEVD